MPVAGQTPTRVHYVDSESVKWTASAAYVDPNDATKLVRDVQAHEQELQLYADDTGAANAYVITLSPAPTIVEGTKFVIKAAHANTGASTLAVNGAAAVAIVKSVSTSLSGGEIQASQIFEVTFDGTNYQLSGSASPNFADNETVTASGTSATLAHTPNPSGSLILSVDGQLLTQGAGADYTLSGANITFATAPRSGANIRAWYRY